MNNNISKANKQIISLLKWQNVLIGIIAIAVLLVLSGGLLGIPLVIMIVFIGAIWIIFGVIQIILGFGWIINWFIKAWHNRENIKWAWKYYVQVERTKPYFQRYIIRDVWRTIIEANK